MEMVVATKVTYKYLMNQSKHDLAQMVLDLLKKEEMQNKDLASVCRVSYHVFVDGVCAECGLTQRVPDLAVRTCKYCDQPVEVGERCHYHWWNPPSG